MLSTARRLRGTILAPDESRSSLTFCWMAVTSRDFKGMTLSRLLTVCGMREKTKERKLEKRTIKTTDNRFFLITLLDNNLNMGVFAGKIQYVVVDEGAGVG